ncbi:L,D-transpeptidase family protein [Marinobacter sediminum]|uniref:L,D-transpeptidase family protein n=1 Tax=Marinobacter sediminum TaxID=256323 RepID=UPI00202F42FB|nr:L,D-transpeptidase family protein [Marinobacter sediminum]MCM0612860.1 L,D-transpeptidase family protein [Marinobacter sediminum]
MSRRSVFANAASLLFAVTIAWLPLCAAANEAIVARTEALDAGFPVKILGDSLLARHALSEFYEARGYQPAWTSPEQRHQLIEAVEQASKDGLNPDDYHAAVLSELALRRMDELSEDLQADLDLLFSDAFLMLGSHLLEGKVNPQNVHAEWTANRRQRKMESVLANAIASEDISVALDELRPSHEAYRKLVQARYRITRLLGQPWLPLAAAPSIRPGDQDQRLPEIRHRMAVLGDLPDQTATTGLNGDRQRYGNELERFVSAFQTRHGLEPDGIIGRQTIAALNMMPVERVRQIDATLERWRWLPESLGRKFVIVNIAGYELKMIENGEEILNKRVIVGQPFRQTPVFSDRIRYLVFNPTWTVPRKLMIEDQLPLIIRDPGYLDRLNITVYQGWGANRKRIDPTTVNWASLTANNFPYQLVQEPGPRNALGQVKFMFPNQYDIYLHDTPGQGLFSRAERSFSSGCIRVEQPFDLAEHLLSQDPDWSQETINDVLAASQPVTVVLPAPVPVYIQYWTAWVDDNDQLQLRNDIYNRDNRLISRLRETPDGDSYRPTPVAASAQR